VSDLIGRKFQIHLVKSNFHRSLNLRSPYFPPNMNIESFKQVIELPSRGAGAYFVSGIK
jgi:hypothetical protein